MSFRDIQLRTVGVGNMTSLHHSNKLKSRSPSTSTHRRQDPILTYSGSSSGGASYLPKQYHNNNSNSNNSTIPVVMGKPVIMVSERSQRIAPTTRYPMDEPAILENKQQQQEHNIYDLSIAHPLRPVASNLTPLTYASSSACTSSVADVSSIMDNDSTSSSSSDSSSSTSEISVTSFASRTLRRRRIQQQQQRQRRRSDPTPIKNNNIRPQSAYAKLSDEIVNFQKLVSELEQLLIPSAHSPEAQWRSRILMRSAKDADRDIWKRLYEYEYQNRHDDASRIQMACRKLHRDFSRTHTHLSTVLETYDRRQQVQVSFLSSSELVEQSSSHRQRQETSSLTRKQQQQLAVEQEQEEFFDRAMRERQEEIENINRSMHKVNEIYTDLAGLVDRQQDQIDKVENNIHVSRGATDLGADEIKKVKNNRFQQARDRINEMIHGVTGMGGGMGGGGGDDNNDSNNESFSSWVRAPLEVIGSDVKQFHQGVVQFTRELVDDIKSNVKESNGVPCPSLCQTGSDDERDPMNDESILQTTPDTVPMHYAATTKAEPMRS